MQNTKKLQGKLLKQVEMLKELDRAKEIETKKYIVVKPTTNDGTVQFGLYDLKKTPNPKSGMDAVAWGNITVIKSYLNIRRIEKHDVMDIHFIYPPNQKPKLSVRQKEIMDFVNKVSDMDTYEYEQGYAYVETGKWKSFSERAFQALIDKKLIEHIDKEIVYGAYCVKPTLIYKKLTK